MSEHLNDPKYTLVPRGLTRINKGSKSFLQSPNITNSTNDHNLNTHILSDTTL